MVQPPMPLFYVLSSPPCFTQAPLEYLIKGQYRQWKALLPMLYCLWFQKVLLSLMLTLIAGSDVAIHFYIFAAFLAYKRIVEGNDILLSKVTFLLLVFVMHVLNWLKTHHFAANLSPHNYMCLQNVPLLHRMPWLYVHWGSELLLENQYWTIHPDMPPLSQENSVSSYALNRRTLKLCGR